MRYFLLILLCLLVFSACGDTQSWQIQQESSAEGLQTLNVQNENGKIVVQTHTENRIVVQAQIEFRSSRKLKADFQLQLIPAAQSLGVRLDKPSLNDGEVLRTHFQLSVPEHLALELTGQNGDIEVTGQAGHLSIDAQNGNISLKQIRGNVQAHSANGNLRLEAVSGLKHSLQTRNGNIELLALNGAVEAATVNGNIQAELQGVSRPEDYSFASDNGSVSLVLPADSSARIRYAKSSGQVKTDFQHLPDQGQILVGSGTARIQVKHQNGNLNVRKP